MKTNSKFLGLALTASVLFFSSCQEDATINETSSDVMDQASSVANLDNEEILVPSTATVVDAKSSGISAKKEIAEVEEFAKRLAASLKEEEMRTFLKDEASKQFDGDYDILVSNVIDTKVGDESFDDKIKGGTENSNARTSNVVDAATKNPKLNISVPVLIEDWDDQKKQPLVAVSMGAVEGETKFIKAYDSNGKEYLLDAETEPDVPVIVVGNNERMGKEFEEAVKENNSNAKTSGRMQQIKYIRCPNLKKIESWYFGGPELRFDGVVYNNNSSTTVQAFKKTRTPSRDEASDGYSFTQDLFRWYFNENQGPDYYIQSWEIDDAGTTHELTVGVSFGKEGAAQGSASYKLTYRAQDKQLAGELINNRNPVTETISDDLIEFRLSEGL